MDPMPLSAAWVGRMGMTGGSRMSFGKRRFGSGCLEAVERYSASDRVCHVGRALIVVFFFDGTAPDYH